MNLQEIKEAIAQGKIVCWSSEYYEVRKDCNNDYYNIVCQSNNSCIGLTWLDGITLNGKESEFYIK